MGIVKKLKEEVFKKIAAGEVVERPASAVKELVENSIDAGADLIEVELINGGKDLIKVFDNGQGFLPDDIMIAFQNHSTSKIKEISDFNRLTTLGFRGEALPSIKEVSMIELRTSNSNDGTGIFCSFINGELVKEKKIVFNRGTKIEVKELFYNFPVRKKFLKTDRTELNRISTILETMAFINYQISFKLTNNHKEVFFFNQTNSLKDRVYQIIGPELFNSLQEIEFSQGDYQIKGLISKLNTGSCVKKHQYYFVNNRPVREATIIAALNNTFKRYLEKSKYAVCILSLKFPPGDIDVNIHPMKQEVKFKNNNFIYGFIKTAIENCFIGIIPIKAEPELNLSFFKESSAPYNLKEPPTLLNGGNKMVKNEPEYLLLGQFHNSFILIEMDSKLLIIDQHNAHERIHYEKLLKQYKDEELISIAPLFPIIIQLTPAENRNFGREMQILLKDIGFDIRPLSGDSIDVKLYPWFIEDRKIKDIIISVLHLEYNRDQMFEKVISDIACKNAIKVNHKLYEEEIRTMIIDLFNTSNPYFCPHKRPIIKELSLTEIEKMLKRK